MTTSSSDAPKSRWWSRLLKRDTPSLIPETAQGEVAPALLMEEITSDPAEAFEASLPDDGQDTTSVELPLDSQAAPPVLSLWQRLKLRLSRSASVLGDGLAKLLGRHGFDAQAEEALVDLLLQSDMGPLVADELVERLKSRQLPKDVSVEQLKEALAEEIEALLRPVEVPLPFEGVEKPHVVLMIGVNGAGKTTTIGKLACLAKRHGARVCLAAGDTFRAAAVEQLRVWAERVGADFVAKPTGSDPASVAFDALDQAHRDGVDVLFFDTAGRLQNRQELMDELSKIIRVVKKRQPDAPHAVLLVLDATTGQNALAQADIFSRVAGVTGLVVTKLDGSARGGVLVPIARTYGLPVHFIGVGESLDDLMPFEAKAYARALVGL